MLQSEGSQRVGDNRATELNWKNLEIIIVSKPDKEKYHGITCMWNLKKKKKAINELIYKTERDSHI